MEGTHGGDIYRNKVKLDFSVNINPLGPPDAVRHALQSAAGRCLEYPDMESSGLKEAVNSMSGIPKEYLLFGNGASELFLGVAHALKPQKTLIPVPSFSGYGYASRAAGSRIVCYPFSEEAGFGPDEGLLEALAEEIDLVWIANPNNPTGKRMDKEFLKTMFRLCRERNIYVVLDECFIEFCGAGTSMAPDVGEFGNVLLVRAFTKIFAVPGVRLGYLVCSDRMLLDKIRRQLPEWNVSVFAQEAGAACAGQADYIARTVRYVEKEREFLADGFQRLGITVYASDANFLLVYSETPLYEMLLEKGILIRDCADFEGLSKGFYRVAVKRRRENEQLLEAAGDCIGKDRTAVI